MRVSVLRTERLECGQGGKRSSPGHLDIGLTATMQLPQRPAPVIRARGKQCSSGTQAMWAAHVPDHGDLCGAYVITEHTPGIDVAGPASVAAAGPPCWLGMLCPIAQGWPPTVSAVGGGAEQQGSLDTKRKNPGEGGGELSRGNRAMLRWKVEGGKKLGPTQPIFREVCAVEFTQGQGVKPFPYSSCPQPCPFWVLFLHPTYHRTAVLLPSALGPPPRAPRLPTNPHVCLMQPTALGPRRASIRPSLALFMLHVLPAAILNNGQFCLQGTFEHVQRPFGGHSWVVGAV